jgi:hypothetical protein
MRLEKRYHRVLGAHPGPSEPCKQPNRWNLSTGNRLDTNNACHFLRTGNRRASLRHTGGGCVSPRSKDLLGQRTHAPFCERPCMADSPLGCAGCWSSVVVEGLGRTFRIYERCP